MLSGGALIVRLSVLVADAFAASVT